MPRLSRSAHANIARILTKLGLRDRVQVAVYAYEHGIVRVPPE
jgi:DNA-binding NarL/FixJ family response regulator